MRVQRSGSRESRKKGKGLLLIGEEGGPRNRTSLKESRGLSASLHLRGKRARQSVVRPGPENGKGKKGFGAPDRAGDGTGLQTKAKRREKRRSRIGGGGKKV